MFVAAIALAIVVVVFLVLRSRGGTKAKPDVDASAALDALVADAVERELAQSVLAMKTDEERVRLRKALRGADADIDVVSQLERAVRGIDLEFIRFAHESDAEVNVTLTYEDGKTVKTTRRIANADLPRSVRDGFEKNATTRAFLAWQLPWRR